MTYGEDPGTFAMLRESNIDKVAELTGHSEEDLRMFLDRAAAKGETKVKIPMLRQHLL